MRRGRRTIRGVVAMAAVVGTGAMVACTAPMPPVIAPDVTTELLALRAQRGPGAMLVDAAGRQVTLRGANFNHLGDYFQSDPRLPTVASLDATDWDDAQALGFNVIRLVTNWSSWEPQRGRYDEAYARRVEAAVHDAEAHGMYVLIDLHQDAWGKHVATPLDHACPHGWQRARGWDGAPAWATFTDGAETCTPDGRRETSPAVLRAWDNFYANRAGIRDAFARLWGFIAGRFAGEVAVAGYDVLNEPGLGNDVDGSMVGLAAAQRSAIASIRAAEAIAAPRAPTHAVFFEPLQGGFPIGPFDLTDDPNLVLAPHTYAESFDDTPGFLDLSLWGYSLAAAVYGVPVVLGEYGAYRDDAFNRSWTSRVHRLADERRFAGDIWWQWEQQCGDPHNVGYPVSEAEVAARLPGCATPRSIQACATRPFPRAVPGRLTKLEAEPCGSGPLVIEGSTTTASTADLWWPAAAGQGPPVVSGDGIASSAARAVPGGYRVFVAVDGDFRVELGTATAAATTP